MFLFLNYKQYSMFINNVSAQFKHECKQVFKKKHAMRRFFSTSIDDLTTMFQISE